MSTPAVTLRSVRPAAVLLCLSLTFMLAACRLAVPSSAPTPSASATAPVDAGAQRQLVQKLLDAMDSAIGAKDAGSWSALVSSRDATFTHRAQIVFDNLTSLPVDHLAFAAEGATARLSEDRSAQLGPSAWVQRATVTWQLPGDSAPAQNTLWLTVLPGGPAGVQLAGVTDVPDGSHDAVPLWTIERVEATQIGNGTALVAADLKATDRWATVADEAAKEIAPRVRRFAPRWSGDIVLEVPSLVANFEQTAGVVRGTYSQIAAVTVPVGPDPATATLHIVLNPKLVKELTDDGLRILLAHESTHVATRSVDSPARLWVVEGIADYVAYDAYPSGRGPAEAPLAVSVRKFGVPPTLPTDASFDPSSKNLGATYAQAYLAWRYVARTYGRAALAAFFTELDSGRSLDSASRKVLHVSSTTFIAGWRSYVRAIVG